MGRSWRFPRNRIAIVVIGAPVALFCAAIRPGAFPLIVGTFLLIAWLLFRQPQSQASAMRDAGAGVWVWDPATRIITCGPHHSCEVHPEDRDRVLAEFASAFSQQSTFETEFRAKSAGG